MRQLGLAVALALLLPATAGALLLPLPPTEPVPVGALPIGVAVDPLTQRVFVAVTGEDVVAVLDALTLQTLVRVPVDDKPLSVALDLPRARVIVGHDAAPLTILDMATLSPLARVAMGRGGQIAVSPPTGDIAVANGLEGTVTIVDGVTLQPRAVIPVGGSARGVAYDGTGRTFVARGWCAEGVPVIQGDAVVAVFPARGCIAAVAYDLVLQRLVAVGWYRPVSILDGLTGALLHEVRAGYWMYAATVDPVLGRALVTGSPAPDLWAGTPGRVYAIDLVGGFVLEDPDTGGSMPSAIAYHPGLRRAYTTDTVTDFLYALST